MNLQIIQNSALCEGIFRMKMDRPAGMPDAVPGQFVHIRCSDCFDPLLRRPFSISGMDGESLEIIYKVVGKGTSLLAKKKAGEHVDVIGPLGRGFTVNHSSDSALIVAGGMGVAPTLYLANTLGEKVKKFLIGAKTEKLLLCRDDICHAGIDVKTCTDDGSCGTEGNAGMLLSSLIEDFRDSIIYACGPLRMLKEIHLISSRNGLTCEVCLENRMACGVGACLGCAVEVFEDGKKTYKRACKDGPVFNGDSIVWENLA